LLKTLLLVKRLKDNMKKQQAISSSAVEYIKYFLDKDNKIMDLVVKNQWLRATLSSGVKFSVRNDS